jgi:hypothetical protein
MSTVSAFAKAPPAAERTYVDRGRAAFAVRFPGQDFDSHSWSIRHLKKSGAGQGNVSLLFTRIEKGHRLVTLPDQFSRAIKACLAIGGKEPGTMYNGSTAARWLWEAIRKRLGSSEEAFSWAGLRSDDAERAEELMIESGMESNSAYRRCVDLQSLLTSLAEAQVIAPMAPIFRTPRQDSLDRQTLDGRAARDELLPSEEAIAALADVYNGQYEISPFEQLMVCVPALMFASSLRIIEPLQFTTNPIRKEGSRHFIYFFKAKGKNVVEDKIPLSSAQASLARDAVDRALLLTSGARVRAKELAESPHQFPLPAWAMAKEWLSESEVADLLGVVSVVLPKGVEKRTDAASTLTVYRRCALQEHLQSYRERYCQESIRGVTKRADGTWLPLHEALFICFRNQGHEEKGTSPLLVSLLRQQQVGTFLGGHANGLKSIFERLGLTEKNGRPVSLNSHQIRHYVTSKASGAGVADAYLVRWQRRAHEGDLEAYKHLTSEERLRRLREHIKSGRLRGDIATMYFSLADGERDVFLATVVQAIHITHFGFCVHDFNSSPCPSALNCVKRCGSFLFDTEDKAQRERLTTLQLRNARALEDAEAALAAGEGVLADEWVRDLKETDEGLRIILQTEAFPGTGLVSPFGDSPSRFQELE